MKKEEKALTLKNLNKSNIWDIQENEIISMWESETKDPDLRDNLQRYKDIIKTAFDIEDLKFDKPEIIKKYENRGFSICSLKNEDGSKTKWAIKKKPIHRITDLTYENIRHISAKKLTEVLDRNFGGGWDSLPQSIQDIIQSGFDISTTTLPQDRLTKPGGMYEKKLNDGFEVLVIQKGTWVEAIFAKEKPKIEKPKLKYEKINFNSNDDETEENLLETKSKYDEEDEEDIFDEDKLTEESYRTTFDTDPDDLNLEAEDISDEEDF